MKKYINDTSNDAQGAVTENSAANVVGSTESKVIDPKKKKPKKKSLFNQILTKGQATFKCQLDRSVNMKRRSLFDAHSKLSTPAYPLNVFLSEYKKDINRLLDSNKFNRDCTALELEAYNVATHVVFEGRKKMLDVFDRGVSNVFGVLVSEFKEPLIDEKTLNQAELNQAIDATK